jgi:hypothetical protein
MQLGASQNAVQITYVQQKQMRFLSISGCNTNLVAKRLYRVRNYALYINGKVVPVLN